MSNPQDQFLPQEIGRDTMQAALALIEASSADRRDDVAAMLATCDPGQLQTGLLEITELLLNVVAQRTGVPAAALIAELRAEVEKVNV